MGKGPDPVQNLAPFMAVSNPENLRQLKIVLVICAIAAFISLYLWGAPILFCMAIGGFLLLPLMGAKGILKYHREALEAYKNGEKFVGTSLWHGEIWSDSVDWTGHLDLGDGGKWQVKIARGGNTEKAMRGTAMEGETTAITAWLLPGIKEPRMLEKDGYLICVSEVTKVLTRLNTES